MKILQVEGREIGDSEGDEAEGGAGIVDAAIKVSIGKLKLQTDYRKIFPGVLEANGFVFLPPAVEHYETVITLPRHHGDPFDRLIIAQAMVEGFTIVTCDQNFSAYGVPLLW